MTVTVKLPSDNALLGLPSDETLRWFWRECGGDFDGKIIGAGHMPESKLLPLLRGLLNRDFDTLKVLRKAPNR